MCGLFGAYGCRPLFKEDIERVNTLGLFSVTRGVDSSGIAVFGRAKKNKTSIRVHKDVGHYLDLWPQKDTDKAFNLDDRFLVMGHTRWATLGAVNLRNAQPIEEGPIILCHNGSVDHFLKDKKSEVDSDSREIARRLTKGNLDATVKDIHDGHFAMTYVDLSRQTFNITRNYHRPFSYMFNKDRTVFYWASVPWMLWALKYKEGFNNFDDVQNLKDDIVWRFPLGSLHGKVINIEKPKPLFIDRAPFQRHRHTSGHAFCTGCKKYQEWCECEKKTVLALPAPYAPAHMYQGYKRVKLTLASVHHCFSKGGCANCTKEGKPTTPVMWFGEADWVCKTCYETDKEVVKDMRAQMPFYEGFILEKVNNEWKRKVFQ